MRGKTFAVSSGFLPEDVPRLSALACQAELDHMSTASRLAPLHAIHALMLLGPHSAQCAPALIARAIRTRFQPEGKPRGDDYASEFVVEALKMALAACGVGALDALEAALVDVTGNSAAVFRKNEDGWVGVVVDAYCDLLVLSGSGEVVQRGAGVLLGFLRAMYLNLMSEKASLQALHFCFKNSLSMAAAHTITLAPFLRTHPALALLRAIRLTLDDCGFS